MRRRAMPTHRISAIGCEVLRSPDVLLNAAVDARCNGALNFIVVELEGRPEGVGIDRRRVECRRRRKRDRSGVARGDLPHDLLVGLHGIDFAKLEVPQVAAKRANGLIKSVRFAESWSGWR